MLPKYMKKSSDDVLRYRSEDKDGKHAKACKEIRMRFSGIIGTTLGSIGTSAADDIFWTNLDAWTFLAIQREISHGGDGQVAIQDKQHLVASLHAHIARASSDASIKLHTPPS